MESLWGHWRGSEVMSSLQAHASCWQRIEKGEERAQTPDLETPATSLIKIKLFWAKYLTLTFGIMTWKAFDSGL